MTADSEKKQTVTETKNSSSSLNSIVETDKDKVDFTAGSSANDFKYYPDTPDAALNKLKFAIKSPSQYYDPCEESSKMSFRCLESNNYDRDLCRDYFDAYRECKKQWLKSRRENRRYWEK
ncbi:related to Cytochrome c oxidase-assembly factor COX23, mitochondrial [Saccharomycodes ludwigii]|uniref:Cytochrome c oxidase-assembly factor COX23, mitochondrial n=1 Tax=Saccharomycodes ludwigii TaxID=36035 RepID=A0A376B771_9ASCO|nr:hypothetical protein SCDLUD_002887 [Saccharomycodes ludwigii]KAH3901395.1 hypothetical protein SCDLUD_002887 [Saccharomycodes ludwigii]SSD60523.1 related to Cytochrome c oxidase-assembly factor COX23, mitochondrial [Saccharomycodes ludwigii]